MSTAADLDSNEDHALLTAARIRQAREDAGMSRMTMAMKLHAILGHTSPDTIRGWERGTWEPRLETLRAIAQVTGKPVRWFLGE